MSTPSHSDGRNATVPASPAWSPRARLRAWWDVLSDAAPNPPEDQPAGNAQTPLLLNSTLEGRLSDLRERLADLRCEVSEYSSRKFLVDTSRLADAEYDLDEVELALDRAVPPPDQYKKAREILKSVQKRLDATDRRLSQHMLAWVLVLSAYASCVLIGAALLAYLLYINKASFNFLGLHIPLHVWPVLRLALLTSCGGLLGAGSSLMRVLSEALPNRALDPRRIVLYFLFPLTGASLAGAFYLLVQAGTGFSALGTGEAATTVAAVFSLGFLIGFLPATVVYRINQIVKAFFGTDQVSAPQVTPPQVVRISQSRIKLSATIVPNSSTRIRSATARLQLVGETQSLGGTTSATLRRGPVNTWVGEVAIPQKKQSNNGTTGEATQGTLVIEARDEQGNIGRSDPVSLPPLQKEEVVDGSGGNALGVRNVEPNSTSPESPDHS